MRRGEIWIANLNPPRGKEMGKIRPVVILQADWLTEQGVETIVILPLSTQRRPSLEPLRVHIQARDQLQSDCQTVPEKIRALDRSKFGEGPITRLTEEEMSAVERSLTAVLGMY
jgi:mRNA interferase MazF